MNQLIQQLLVTIVITFVLAGAQRASAFYDPGISRWINRDPLAVRIPQTFHDRDVGGFVEMQEGLNLFWALRNSPVSHHDKDGRIVPVVILVGVVAILAGCKIKPTPPPDPDGCWAATNPKKLPDPTRASCATRKADCLACCEGKYPINGGDATKYEACVKSCEAGKLYCDSGGED